MTAHDASTPTALARPRLTIDLDAVANNWRFFQSHAAAAETGAVVKADAYGLGAAQVARKLAAAGCRTFFVANAEEGAEVRAAVGAEVAIYVLDGILPGEQPLFRAHALRPVLNTDWQIDLWIHARASGPASTAALHVDTGIHRLGLTSAAMLSDADRVRAAGVDLVMSHLACAATPDHPLNAEQLARFRSIADAAVAALPGVRLSLSNSGGVLLGAPFHFDLVRPGIGLYGGQPHDHGRAAIAAAVTLEAPILQVSRIQTGDTVGYGAEHEAVAACDTATVALGYADGFLRMSGGRGYGVLAGARTPILGRVSMDLITVDVTAARPHAKPGALITFLGVDPTVDDAARAAKTANYEILTRLGPRCVRRHVGEAG